MAKRGGFPGGMPGNMNNLMKQAQRMQRQMEETTKELEEKEYTAAAGGGAVTVTVSAPTRAAFRRTRAAAGWAAYCRVSPAETASSMGYRRPRRAVRLRAALRAAP